MIVDLVLTGLMGVGAGCLLGSMINANITQKKIDRLNDEIRDLDFLKEEHKYRYHHERTENSQNIRDYNYLLSEFRKLQKKNATPNVNKEVMKAAAKKAMFASHPDRTGRDTSDEFIKFNELYKSLK